MRESLISLRHLVNLVPLADGVPLTGKGLEDFRGERGLHRHALMASAKSTIQRKASAFWRSAGISSGT